MNNKYFVGQDATSFKAYAKNPPITQIILATDEGAEDAFYAGTEGYSLTVYCPWATQQMANDLLAKAQGFEYQGFEAGMAALPGEAERGDAVTVNGIYGMIADRTLYFNPGMNSDISAPYEEEVNHEFQYVSPIKQEFDRKIGQVQASLTVDIDNIKLEVEDEINQLSSSITVQLNSITSQITGLDGQVSAINQTVGSISTQITGINGDISSLEQTANSLQSQITSANGDISTLQQYSNQLSSIITNVSGDVSTLEQKVDSITLSVSNAYSSSTIELLVNGISVASERIRFTGTVVFEDELADGTTTVSGDCITTGEVSARYIRLGGQMDVYESLSSSADVGGYIGYMTGMTAAGSSTSGIAICSYDESALVICTNAGVRMGYDGVSTVVCTSSQVSIRGDAVYINGEPQSASDARLKTQVQEDLDRYLPVFDKLRPVTFVYDGHKRRHMGFIAQEIQQTLADEGIPESDFAALCTEVPNEERPMGMYSLRYGELQIMTVAKVQQMDKRLKELEAKLVG